MRITPETTIIQQIQPQCDALHIKLKEQKELLHETNQSVADSTGIPLSNVGKFFSGSLASPSVFYTAAMCIYLDMSLDELMGIKADTHSRDAERLKELERQLEAATHDLARCEQMNQHFADGIKERRQLLVGMTALCAVLVFALVLYVIMDAKNLYFGFITQDGIAIDALLLVAAVLGATGYLILRVIKKHKKNVRKDK